MHDKRISTTPPNCLLKHEEPVVKAVVFFPPVLAYCIQLAWQQYQTANNTAFVISTFHTESVWRSFVTLERDALAGKFEKHWCNRDTWTEGGELYAQLLLHAVTNNSC